jgi:signal transduction histidine kinase
LFRSSSFRLTLLYAGLFGGSVVLLFGLIYWATAGYLTRQLDAVVETELALLADETGPGELGDAIRERMAVTSNRAAYYAARGPDGAWIGGNLRSEALPTLLEPGWHEVRAVGVGGAFGVGREEGGRLIRGKTAILPDGSALFAGQDSSRLGEVRELIGHALLLGGGITLALALLGGAVMNAGIQRRMEAINVTSEHIVSGDLGRRIPRSAMGDEFDRLAANLNAMLDRIEQLVESMRQISNDIAHDLRTPLTRLRHNLEAARARRTAPETYEAAIDRAIAETDAILDTFGALLRIAQIESGTRKAGFRAVDLSSVVEAVVEVYAPAAEEKRQHLAAAVAPGMAATGDRELLTQMAANLIENAIRHAPAGTRIGIELAPAGGAARLVVADRGPGIPAHLRDKVLRRFYRLDASRSTAGSGLGLSLVSAVAELHGAAVRLEDNRPGLRVVVDLPRAPPPTDAAGERSKACESVRRRR